MKRLLFILSLTILSIPAQSQVLITLLLGDKLNSDKLEFGLEGGLNWSKISGLETNTYHRDWNLGFYFNFKMSDSWYINTGVLVKSKLGVDKLTDNDLNFLSATIYKDLDDIELDGEYSQQLSYFLVPVLAKYKFKNHIYVEAGPQFGLMYKSWIEFESDADGKDVFITEYNRENINKIEVGAAFGLGYTLFKGTGWTIGAKYYYGFVNVYKDKPGTNNSSFFIKMNIPIGAGENAQKKAAEKAKKKQMKKAEKNNSKI